MDEYDVLLEKKVGEGAEQLGLENFSYYNRFISGLSDSQKNQILTHFYEKRKADLLEKDPLMGPYGSVLGEFLNEDRDGYDINPLMLQFFPEGEEGDLDSQAYNNGEITIEELNRRSYQRMRDYSRQILLNEMENILNQEQLNELERKIRKFHQSNELFQY